MKKINFNKVQKETLKKIKFLKHKKDKVSDDTEEEMKAKKPNNKKRSKLGYRIIVGITILAIIAFLGIVAFCYYIYKTAPEFDESLLYEKEATLIYDSSNTLIATLGTEKREKISYDELPEVLVDAVIATEDSRFFQHNGFDLPRFAKATLGQLLGNSSAGGASTLTMQVSKNSFTSTEANGIAGIIRKFTDIYMSIFKIERNYTKQEILELYVNSPYLGSGAYGVEQASQTYFGKSVKDLSLPEAALIAGLFQAPGAYDPYLNPNDAEARRNQVLNLMVRHGYIDKKTADEAKAISVQSLLVSDSYTVLNEYQGFIDTVVQAVIDDTGNSPYNVPMIIYSTMVASKQDVINDFYSGKSGYKFKDDKIQVGISVIDNKTGAIIAVGAGRNKTKEMTFNYATMTNAHPGSTAKPIFEYGPGIENNKWSTYTPFFDDPTKYTGGGTLKNWNNKYDGMLSLYDCLSQSKNTCAVQAFQHIDNKIIYDYVTSVGITPESTNGYIGEAHALGAFTGVSPVTLGAAYAVFGSGGYYTKPYSYTKVIYRDSDEQVEQDITRTKVISEQTTYMISNVLYAVTPAVGKVSGTNVATKTGTSSYDEALLKKYGLTSTTIRDSWVATYTPDYTITFWYGYDSLDDEHYACKCYNLTSAATVQRRTIQGILAKGIFEKNSKFENPGGIVSAKVEFGTIPAQSPSPYTPADLIDSYLFLAGTEPTEVSTRFSKLTDPTDLTVNESGSTLSLSWTSPGLPTAVDNTYLESYFASGYEQFATKYYTKRLDYNKTYVGNFGFEIYLVNGSSSEYVGWTANSDYTLNLSNHPGNWNAVLVKSAYSIFKPNASSGVQQYLSSYEAPVTIDITMKSLTMSKNTSWSGSGKPDITSIEINGSALTTFDATLQISTIKVGNTATEVTLSNMLSTPGTYTVTYMVTFSYVNSENVTKRYTKTAKQTVTITN